MTETGHFIVKRTPGAIGLQMKRVPLAGTVRRAKLAKAYLDRQRDKEVTAALVPSKPTAAPPMCGNCKRSATHILGGSFSKLKSPRVYFCADHAREWNLAHKFGEKAAVIRAAPA
ncbi:MAG: hypothetical protein HY556_10120 [Euryarchaeota archaeon]|nr:hypothetical protein [Euryarchaeota archaeon]